MISWDKLFALAKRWYRRHAWTYGSLALLGVALMLFLPAWWLFWPVMAWTFVFAVHFLLVRSLEVSGDWVSERVARTADKAYDIGHIEDIRASHEARIGGRAETGPDEPARPRVNRPEGDSP